MCVGKVEFEGGLRVHVMGCHLEGFDVHEEGVIARMFQCTCYGVSF